jgi:hypothetical protein
MEKLTDAFARFSAEQKKSAFGENGTKIVIEAN